MSLVSFRWQSTMSSSSPSFSMCQCKINVILFSSPISSQASKMTKSISRFFLQHPANPDLLYIIFFCHSQVKNTISCEKKTFCWFSVPSKHFPFPSSPSPFSSASSLPASFTWWVGWAWWWSWLWIQALVYCMFVQPRWWKDRGRSWTNLLLLINPWYHYQLAWSQSSSTHRHTLLW